MGDQDDSDTDSSQNVATLESDGDDVVIPVSDSLLRDADLDVGDDVEVTVRPDTEEIQIQKRD